MKKFILRFLCGLILILVLSFITAYVFVEGFRYRMYLEIGTGKTKSGIYWHDKQMININLTSNIFELYPYRDVNKREWVLATSYPLMRQRTPNTHAARLYWAMILLSNKMMYMDDAARKGAVEGFWEVYLEEGSFAAVDYALATDF